MTNLRDVELGISVEDFDATVRGVNWVQHLATLFDAEVTGNAIWVPSDSTQQAVLTAFWALASIDIAFTDQPIANVGADGLRSPFHVFTNNRGEPVREGVTLDWTFRPALQTAASEVPQRWVTT
jgi:hypothetical protein